jgi:hypothetical protein
MDQTPTAVGDLEAVEAWDDALRGTAEQGVGKALAAKVAGSAHGPWQLANSPALAIALPNAYRASLGIPPLTVRR